MKSLIALAALSVGMTVSTAAAAKGGPNPDETDQRIGPQVGHICFPSNISGWRALEGQDNVVLLNRSVSRWYYVQLTGACDYHTLNFAENIAIKSIPGGGCLTRGDTIIVKDTPGFSRRCTIKRMYEWNDDAPASGEEQSEGAEADK